MPDQRPLPRLVSYGLLPGALAAAVVVTSTASGASGRAAALPAVLVATIAVAMLVEWWRPLRAGWRMTARSLGRRDLPYIGVGLAVERACEVAVAAIARATVPADGFGPVGRLPGAVQVILAIATFDLCWYAYHRAAHARARLWRVHGAHHTPGQMYVLMHGVFHPLDELVVRFVLALAVFRFGGFGPGPTTVALAVIGVVGIVSHVNADVRLWALNHVLIGPETHRYHHSADHAANYGAVTSVWDQAFGTFHFSVDPPARLGLADPTSYPAPERFHQVLAWPLRRSAPRPRSEPSLDAAPTA